MKMCSSDMKGHKAIDPVGKQPKTENVKKCSVYSKIQSTGNIWIWWPQDRGKITKQIPMDSKSISS